MSDGNAKHYYIYCARAASNPRSQPPDRMIIIISDDTSEGWTIGLKGRRKKDLFVPNGLSSDSWLFSRMDWYASLWLILRLITIIIASFLVFFLIILRLIRRYYHTPIPAFAIQLIDNPIRRRLIQPPEKVAERIGLKPGMIVVEIGPGKGSYTEAVAKRVLPHGRVYAVDIQDSVIERLKLRVKKKGIMNILPRVDNAYDLSFCDGSVDRVFAIACLPEIPEPVKVLKEIHRVLNEDGIVSLSELFPDPDYPSRKTEIRWAEEAGFELIEEYGSWFVYQLNFRKKRI